MEQERSNERSDVLQVKDTTDFIDNQIFQQENEPPDDEDEVIILQASDYLVTLSKDIPRPQVAFRYGDAVIATLGNLSLVTGKAKSRKTFFTTILTAAACHFGGYLNYRSELPANKPKVLFFDTEQNPYYCQLVLKRLEKLECNMDYVVMYGLRPLTAAQRFDLIEKVIYTTDNVGVVVIDGIRDLLYDFNDPTESSELVSELMRWSYERNIHIVNVLHQNKSDNNARGHLGTELLNKAETVLSVSKTDGDDTISLVTAEYCRGIAPEDFYFEIDQDGLPVEASHAEIRTPAKSFDVRDVPENDVFEMFQKIFNGKKLINYGELRQQTKYHFMETFKKNIGDNKTRDLITHAMNKGWLIQDGDRKPYRLGRIDEEIAIETSDLPF